MKRLEEAIIRYRRYSYYGTTNEIENNKEVENQLEEQ